MFVIGFDEIEKAPPLGEFVACPHCGQQHEVKCDEIVLDDGALCKSTIAYFICRGKTCLAGIDGKDMSCFFGV
jgi:hypothetical protein